MIDIDFWTKKDGHIKFLRAWGGVVPNIGDTVELCWNDGERAREDEYLVVGRKISDRLSTWVTIILKPL